MEKPEEEKEKSEDAPVAVEKADNKDKPDGQAAEVKKGETCHRRKQ